MEYETGIPVYYLSNENLSDLGVSNSIADYYALIEEKLWDDAGNQEVTEFLR